MRILVRLPNWIGDAVMATPAIEELLLAFPAASFTLVGSRASAQLFSRDARFEKVLPDESKGSGNRIGYLWRLAKELGSFDIALTFQNSFLSALFLRFTDSKVRIGFGKELRSFLLTSCLKYPKKVHQSERYLALVEAVTGKKSSFLPTKLFAEPFNFEKPTLGINPGAAYGSAKRWKPERFADSAFAFADSFDIVIFGSSNEADSAAIIEEGLRQTGALNIINLAGKTSLHELVDMISALSLFITNDSGPMHIAGAFGVPTVAIFGPTDESETAPWRHDKIAIVRKNLPCVPCKKRVCPLRHHECMELIRADEVIAAAKTLVDTPKEKIIKS